MKTKTLQITELVVNKVEAARLAAILSDVSGGAVTHRTRTPAEVPAPLHFVWVWFDAVARGHQGVGGRSDSEHVLTLNAADTAALRNAMAVYMRDRKVSALDDVDVAIVRSMLFDK